MALVPFKTTSNPSHFAFTVQLTYFRNPLLVVLQVGTQTHEELEVGKLIRLPKITTTATC